MSYEWSGESGETDVPPPPRESSAERAETNDAAWGAPAPEQGAEVADTQSSTALERHEVAETPMYRQPTSSEVNDAAWGAPLHADDNKAGGGRWVSDAAQNDLHHQRMNEAVGELDDEPAPQLEDDDQDALDQERRATDARESVAAAHRETEARAAVDGASDPQRDAANREGLAKAQCGETDLQPHDDKPEDIAAQAADDPARRAQDETDSEAANRAQRTAEARDAVARAADPKNDAANREALAEAQRGETELAAVDGDADTADSSRDAVRRSPELVDQIVQPQMSSMDSPVGMQDAGESGEAATASLIADVLGGDLVYQHTPGEAPQGIDLSYLNDGQLHVAEVKSVIGDWHQPSTSHTVDGRQMDAGWVADRMDRTGVEMDPSDVGTAEDQVHTDLFQVDFPGDTIARYDIDTDGQRSETSPSEIYALSDVLGVHEAANAADVEAASESSVQGELNGTPEGGPAAV